MTLITVILPVYNEEKYIELSIQAVLDQDYPGPVEIYIVDGYSTDSTREIVARIQRSHPNVFIIDNPQKIVPTGMNAALACAKGEIIVRVDGHCIIANDYLSSCVKHILNDKVDAVGGPMRTVGESPVSKVIAVAMSVPFGVGNSAFRTEMGKTMFADTVPFPAYTSEITKKVGYYDEELIRNQDDEYNYRIRDMGGKILLASDVQSTYYSRGSLKALWKQYYQYGFWKVRVLQKHPRQMSLRQFAPPLFVASLLGSALLSLFVAPLWFLFPSLLLIYLTVNVLVSFAKFSEVKEGQVLLLPLCFLILHLSYGTGFLVGLIKFASRWTDKAGKVPIQNV